MGKPHPSATAAIALAAFAVFSIAAPAAPLDPKGIPADARGIVHIDLELGAKTKLGDACAGLSEKALLKTDARSKDYDDFKKQTGIDPARDIGGVTIGFLKNDDDPEPPVMVAVVRGQFSPDKIIAAAGKNGCAISRSGAVTLIDVSSLATWMNRAVANTNANAASETFAAFAGIVNAGAIILAETAADIERAAGALAGATPSYAPPAALDALAKRTGAPLVLAHIDGSLVKNAGPETPMPKTEDLFLSLVEKGDDLGARIISEYATPEAARKAQATIRMLIGLSQLGTAVSDSPEAVLQMQNLQRLIDGLRMNVNGKTLTVTATLPVADIVRHVEKQIAAKQVR